MEALKLYFSGNILLTVCKHLSFYLSSCLIHTLSYIFPNVVLLEKLQHLDQEWREFMYDEETSLLVDQCSTTQTDELWGKVSTDKYPTLLAFCKAMLTIPVSNVDCERVF